MTSDLKKKKPHLHTDGPKYNQKTPIIQANKIMKSGLFLGGWGAPVRFYVNGYQTPSNNPSRPRSF